MLIRSLALALCAGAIVAGCGDDGGGGPGPLPDAGPAADAGAPTATLAFLRSSVGLLHGESTEVQVRYLRADGSPAVDQPIELGLLGEAHDSSLDATCVVDGAPTACLTPRTDATGTARATIRAGAVSAVFRVRGRVPDAAPAILEVSVDGGGFGGLLASLPYAGDRGVVSRTVRLFADAACGEAPLDLLARTPDLARTVGPMLDRVEFGSLPASRRYTLLAVGRGTPPPGGLPAPTLALGCREGVEVTAGEAPRQVTVALEDLPVVVDGAYQVGLVVVGTAHPPRVGEAVLDTAQDAVDAAGSEEDLVLDQLAAVLDAAGEPAALDAVEAARGGDGAAALRSRLDASRQGPLDGADWLALALEDAVGTFQIGGDLVVALAEPVPARFELRSLRGGVDADALVLDLAMVAGASVTPTLAWTLPATIGLAPLTVALPLGSASVAAVSSLLARSDAPSTAHLLADEVGCSALDAWIDARDEIAAGCGPACVRAACEAAFGGVTAGLEARLRTLDGRRPALVLEGEGAIATPPSDFRAATLRAERLDGAWRTSGGDRFDPVRGALVGTRVVR